MHASVHSYIETVLEEVFQTETSRDHREQAVQQHKDLDHFPILKELAHDLEGVDPRVRTIQHSLLHPKLQKVAARNTAKLFPHVYLGSEIGAIYVAVLPTKESEPAYLKTFPFSPEVILVVISEFELVKLDVFSRIYSSHRDGFRRQLWQFFSKFEGSHLPPDTDGFERSLDYLNGELRARLQGNPALLELDLKKFHGSAIMLKAFSLLVFEGWRIEDPWASFMSWLEQHSLTKQIDRSSVNHFHCRIFVAFGVTELIFHEISHMIHEHARDPGFGSFADMDLHKLGLRNEVLYELEADAHYWKYLRGYFSVPVVSPETALVAIDLVNFTSQFRNCVAFLDFFFRNGVVPDDFSVFINSSLLLHRDILLSTKLTKLVGLRPSTYEREVFGRIQIGAILHKFVKLPEAAAGVLSNMLYYYSFHMLAEDLFQDGGLGDALRSSSNHSRPLVYSTEDADRFGRFRRLSELDSSELRIAYNGFDPSGDRAYGRIVSEFANSTKAAQVRADFWMAIEA